MRGVRPSLRSVSAALARPAETLKQARAVAGTHGVRGSVLPAGSRSRVRLADVPEGERLEQAAELARRAADECLALERMLLERRAAVSR